ncbi:MAG: cyclodeaminase/cyclohydrolase family protein [Defluviitaleaceae bacterium]|nr:cyclodeaminase/cyclohydrolase family protein [Defluviitaleaceae bacterium]
MLRDLSVVDFLGELAAEKSTPGGGGVAALAGACGVALVEMVANFSTGRKKYEEHQDVIDDILSKGEEYRKALLEAIDGDAAAYGGVSAAYKMPKETDEEKAARSEAIQKALKAATLSPLGILESCTKGMELVDMALDRTNPNIIGDLAVAAIQLKSGAESAWINVLVNLPSIKDEGFVAEATKKGQEALEVVGSLHDKIIKAIVVKMGGA